MNKKTIFISVGIIAFVIILVITSSNYSESGWTNKDGGYEEPNSGSIQLSPNQKDIDFIVDKTNYAENEVVLALIESDNDVQKAIEYLNQQ